MGRIHISRSLKKRSLVLLTMLIAVLAIGVVNGKISERAKMATTKDYVNYESQEIDEHDGEVLVDSIKLASLPGISPEEDVDQGTLPEGNTENLPGESTIVITSDDISDMQSADTYFAEIRATMDMDRSEILSMLSTVIDQSDSGAERENATKQKLKIIEYMNTEKVIENLIVNKGFAEAFVVMTDSSVNVSVNKQELSQSDVAKIMDVVIRETGRPAQQIVIQNKDK